MWDRLDVIGPGRTRPLTRVLGLGTVTQRLTALLCTDLQAALACSSAWPQQSVNRVIPNREPVPWDPALPLHYAPRGSTRCFACGSCMVGRLPLLCGTRHTLPSGLVLVVQRKRGVVHHATFLDCTRMRVSIAALLVLMLVSACLFPLPSVCLTLSPLGPDSLHVVGGL
jgi:hypothetical protein